jgi:hypothetical protein
MTREACGVAAPFTIFVSLTNRWIRAALEESLFLTRLCGGVIGSGRPRSSYLDRFPIVPATNISKISGRAAPEAC